jgi:hypothetical protein
MCQNIPSRLSTRRVLSLSGQIFKNLRKKLDTRYMSRITPSYINAGRAVFTCVKAPRLRLVRQCERRGWTPVSFVTDWITKVLLFETLGFVSVWETLLLIRQIVLVSPHLTILHNDERLISMQISNLNATPPWVGVFPFQKADAGFPEVLRHHSRINAPNIRRAVSEMHSMQYFAE